MDLLTRSGTMAREAFDVLVVSPHFDDVPLSLGESLRSGLLADHRVRVRTVFGRTNWTSRVHPTPGRAPVVSIWRRVEETAASLVFGYRWSAGDLAEVVLRSGDLDAASFLDPRVDLRDEPLVRDVEAWLHGLLGHDGRGERGSRRPGRRGSAVGPRPVDRPDLVLAPIGLGGHLDHMIIATAAGNVIGSTPVPIGFYEDRPYRAYVSDEEVQLQVERMIGTAERTTVSPTIRLGTQKLVRMCYPSQMTPYFRDAMALDRKTAATESVWFPAGRRPSWFVMPS